MVELGFLEWMTWDWLCWISQSMHEVTDVLSASLISVMVMVDKLSVLTKGALMVCVYARTVRCGCQC